MKTYIFDLDSLSKKYSDYINKLYSKGNKIIISSTEKEKIKILLKKLKTKYHYIIGSTNGTQVLINDEGAIIQKHNPRYVKIKSKNTIEDKIYNTLAVIAWVNWKYSITELRKDYDDHIQTMIIAESLIKNNGFNHKHLVKKYREEPKRTAIICKNLNYRPHKKYYGQIKQLIDSKNLNYLAKEGDGITDGSAMKVSPIAAFYLNEALEKFVKITDKITKITHNTTDARLAAILVALRYRQVFKGYKINDINYLVKNFIKSTKILKLEEETFLKQVLLAAKITKNEKDPEKLLIKLQENIGLAHLAISTPITACFWSFRAESNYKYWFNKISGPLSKPLNKKTHEFLKNRVLKYIKKGLRGHIKSLKDNNDIDTFFSISFGIIAAIKNIDSIKYEIKTAEKYLMSNVKEISNSLINKKIFYIDLDGVVLKYGKMKFTKNALDLIKEINTRGDKVILTTLRNKNNSPINIENTKEFLEKNKFKFDNLIEDLPSPRILITNKESISINHQKDKPIKKINFLGRKKKINNMIILKLTLLFSNSKSLPFYLMDNFLGRIGLMIKKYNLKLYQFLLKIKSKLQKVRIINKIIKPCKS